MITMNTASGLFDVHSLCGTGSTSILKWMDVIYQTNRSV